MPEEFESIQWSSEQADLAACVDLLQVFALPTEDISENSFSILQTARYQGQLVALGGLESYGKYVLLRSVVVQEKFQGRGIAKELVLKLLENAKQQNKSGCYLLTNTAENFFNYLSFKKVERDQVPDPIKQSTEYSELCPDSAVVMFRALV